jgi:hypothetical protein
MTFVEPAETNVIFSKKQVDERVRFLLDSQQDLSLRPQGLKPIIITLVWRKQVYHHISKVHQIPAGAAIPFHFGVNVEIRTHAFHHGVRQGIQHTVTAAGANHKIVGKGANFVDIQQNDVLSDFFFQNIDDGMSKFKRFQNFTSITK